MPTLAEEITGCSAAQLYEATVPTLTTASYIWYPEGKEVRGSVRVRAQLTVGPEELDIERQEVVQYKPQAIK